MNKSLVPEWPTFTDVYNNNNNNNNLFFHQSSRYIKVWLKLHEYILTVHNYLEFFRCVGEELVWSPSAS